MTDSLLTELMTADQVAALLQMRRSTVEDYARRGLLPSLKLGRHRRFVRSDVEAAIAELRDGCRRDEHPPSRPAFTRLGDPAREAADEADGPESPTPVRRLRGTTG